MAGARGHADRARLLMTDGVLTALGLRATAGLLKTIGLYEIGVFAFVFGFRSAMKRVFASERLLLLGGQPS